MTEYKEIKTFDELIEKEHGKIVKLKGFPKDHKVKLFRVVLSTQRTDYVVTNDFAQDNTQAVQEVCDLRWKIEQFHRETKQLTGLESANVAKPELSVTTLGVPSWYGSGLSRLPKKPSRRFIRSNMAYYPIIYASS